MATSLRKSRGDFPFGRLPEELQREVVGHIGRQPNRDTRLKELHSLCLVSKATRQVATPLLYTSLLYGIARRKPTEEEHLSLESVFHTNNPGLPYIRELCLYTQDGEPVASQDAEDPHQRRKIDDQRDLFRFMARIVNALVPNTLTRFDLHPNRGLDWSLFIGLCEKQTCLRSLTLSSFFYATGYSSIERLFEQLIISIQHLNELEEVTFLLGAPHHGAENANALDLLRLMFRRCPDLKHLGLKLETKDAQHSPLAIYDLIGEHPQIFIRPTSLLLDGITPHPLDQWPLGELDYSELTTLRLRSCKSDGVVEILRRLNKAAERGQIRLQNFELVFDYVTSDIISNIVRFLFAFKGLQRLVISCSDRQGVNPTLPSVASIVHHASTLTSLNVDVGKYGYTAAELDMICECTGLRTLILKLCCSNVDSDVDVGEFGQSLRSLRRLPYLQNLGYLEWPYLSVAHDIHDHHLRKGIPLQQTYYLALDRFASRVFRYLTPTIPLQLLRFGARQAVQVRRGHNPLTVQHMKIWGFKFFACKLRTDEWDCRLPRARYIDNSYFLDVDLEDAATFQACGGLTLEGRLRWGLRVPEIPMTRCKEVEFGGPRYRGRP